MLNRFTKIIFGVIIISVICIGIISNKVITNTHYNLIDAPASQSNEGLEELVANMYEDIDYENKFNIAYLNNSAKVSEEDIKILGNVIYNEAKGLSKLEQSCVAWTVMNRCNRYNLSVKQVATAPYQFAYRANLKLKSEKANTILAECEALAKDVIIRYLCEKDGFEEVGRTLPSNYYYFHGDGKHNYFKTQLHTSLYWDYSLSGPY